MHETDGVREVMSDHAYRDALARLAVDPEFAARLDGDPDVVARALGLSPEQVTQLRRLRVDSGTADGPATLDARLSKSSLLRQRGPRTGPSRRLRRALRR